MKQTFVNTLGVVGMIFLGSLLVIGYPLLVVVGMGSDDPNANGSLYMLLFLLGLYTAICLLCVGMNMVIYGLRTKHRALKWILPGYGILIFALMYFLISPPSVSERFNLTANVSEFMEMIIFMKEMTLFISPFVLLMLCIAVFFTGWITKRMPKMAIQICAWLPFGLLGVCMISFGLPTA